MKPANRPEITRVADGPAVRRHRPGGAAGDVHPGKRPDARPPRWRHGDLRTCALATERRLLTRWTANLGFFVVASVTGIVFSALDLTQLETSLSPRATQLPTLRRHVHCRIFHFARTVVPRVVREAVDHELGVVPYLAPRLAVVGAYAAYIIILDFNGDAWELHHYLIAWIGTLFCAFDHPASVVCLAITTGIFAGSCRPAATVCDISDRPGYTVDRTRRPHVKTRSVPYVTSTTTTNDAREPGRLP